MGNVKLNYSNFEFSYSKSECKLILDAIVWKFKCPFIIEFWQMIWSIQYCEYTQGLKYKRLISNKFYYVTIIVSMTTSHSFSGRNRLEYGQGVEIKERNDGRMPDQISTCDMNW